jgi:hypothetical protein
MKVKMAIAVIALFLFVGTAGRATAQSKTTTHKKVRTLTGCLQKGDSANEYQLTTAKGATWEIKSDSVNLGEHAGHRVTITGVLPNATMHGMKEDAKAEAREHGMDKNSTEHGHMTVTNLKMVSETCRD